MHHLVKSGNELPRHDQIQFVDFETTSGDPKVKATNPRRDSILGIACGNKQDQWYIPIRHRNEDSIHNIDYQNVRLWFIEFVANNIWRNLGVKFDAAFAWWDFGCRFFYGFEELMILAHLNDENRAKKEGGPGFSLNSVYEQMTGEQVAKSALIERALKQKRSKDYGDIPLDLMAVYACRDIELTAIGFEKGKEKLPSDLTELWEMESELIPILVKIENTGVKINEQEVAKRAYASLSKAARAQELMSQKVGIEFNPDSNEELSDVMFNWVKVPLQRRTSTGKASWDNEAVNSAIAWAQRYNEFALEFLEHLKVYKEHSRLANTFYVPWMQGNYKGRIYTRYNQTGTVTGRLSSSGQNDDERNMQNIPKVAREVFVADEGHEFYFADYSQLEYRFFAYYAGGRLRQAYIDDPDIDFHQWTCDRIKALVDIELDRRHTKNVNFGAIYGMGEDKTKRTIADQDGGITLSQAGLVIQTYHKEFPEVRPLRKKIESVCRARAFVRNIFGRRRRLTKERVFKAFNALCQGGAADAVKKAMILLDRENFDLRWNVHDEIGVQQEKGENRSEEMKEIMEGVIEDKFDGIPLRVDMVINDSWKG